MPFEIETETETESSDQTETETETEDVYKRQGVWTAGENAERIFRAGGSRI